MTNGNPPLVSPDVFPFRDVRRDQIAGLKPGKLLRAGCGRSWKPEGVRLAPLSRTVAAMTPAYAAPEQSTPGQQIPIRVDGGLVVQATVVQLPFFDPANQRQEL